MQQRWILAAGILVLSLSHPAISHAEILWNLGFKGGLGLGRVSGETSFSDVITDPDVGDITIVGDPTSFQGGFVGGAFARAQLSKLFGLQLEFLYAQKGGRGDIDLSANGSPLATGEMTYQFNYFEIPLLAMLNLGVGERYSFDLFAGPAIAFSTDAEVRYAYQNEEKTRDLSNDLNSTDYGLCVGAAYNLPGGDEFDMQLGARYTLGLSDVSDSGSSFKNQYLSFMLGISFPIREDADPPD